MRHLKKSPSLCLLFPVAFFAFVCQAQNWSGILANSRAIDWSHAGLPATFLDGETTPNPWTPPARTQCGSTVPAGTSFATINSSLAACPAGTYLLLGPGTFSSSSATITLGSQNNVTLRGSGADKTFINCSGTCGVDFGNPSRGAHDFVWSSGLSQGSTTIGFGSAPGSVAGDILIFYGISNNIDSGGTFVCSPSPTCSSAGGNNNQSQNVLITGVSGSTATISPAVYMPNWATQFGNYNLTVVSNTSQGDGLEDLSFDFTGNTSVAPISMNSCYACWVKGNRFVNGNGNYHIKPFQSESYLIANNFFYGGLAVAPGSVDMDTDSDGLIINNITQMGTFYWQSGSAGDVLAYNYQRDAVSNTGNQIYAPVTVEHESGGSYILLEGNEQGAVQFDNIHGTQNLDTVFRNLFSSNDPPYPAPGNAQAIGFQGIARFMNAIGNVLGSAISSAYQCTPSGCSGAGAPIYYIGSGPGGGPKDALALQSSFRWGNWDTVTGATRWCGNSSNPGWSTTCSSTSEVPTALGGNAATYNNPVPSSTTLPASFFMPVTAHLSGGTGLSWWKVCTNYPTCSASQTQPFPPIGPDVTGGGAVIGNSTDIYSGHAYDIPAALAWKYLPIDTTYQESCPITSESWSSGTETINFSSSCASTNGKTPKGPFQVSGANFTCPTLGQAQECQMTGSTSTSVSFALASNPGSCSGSCGNFLYPDVRTFNENVYSTDSGGTKGATLAPPTNVSGQVAPQ